MAQLLKNLPAMWETWIRSLGWKDPWRKAWQPTPVSCLEKSHGQRSLEGYSPGSQKESDTTEHLSTYTDMLGTDPVPFVHNHRFFFIENGRL